MKKVGFLGGSFDPIHFGQLQLAIQMLEICHLDQVLFCPAAVSPHKMDRPPHVSGEHRLAMVKLAIADVPQFACLDYEIHRPAPSYTIDTLQALRAERGDVQLYLILGEDQLKSLPTWKGYEQIISLARLLVGRRSASSALLTPAEEDGVKVVPTPEMEISSTLVRKRLQERLYCGHLLPAKVLDYIHQHQLYYHP